MTYEQYWEGDPWMVRAYAQAYLLKRKIDNENMWIMGSYVTSALNSVIGTAFGKRRVNYIEKPIEFFPKTDMEKNAEIKEEKRKLIAWLNGFKKTFNKKHTGSELNGESRDP